MVNFFKDEIIDDYRCEKCNKINKISKSFEIVKFPEILIVFVKRFLFYPYMKKLKNRINFSNPVLDLRDFYIDYQEESSKVGTEYFNKQKRSSKFRLKGFINHYGEVNYGHYTAICKGDGDEWIKFNDKKISLKNESILNLSESQVYMLFY